MEMSSLGSPAARSLLLGWAFFLGAASQLQAVDTYREGYDAGYADGLDAGRQDARSGRAFDFANKRFYQMAERGFKPDVHERDVYVVAYRRGFEDGYGKGYGLDETPAVPAVSSAVVPVRAADEPRPAAILRDRPTPSEDVEVPAGIQIKARLLSTLSTQYNGRGDPFRAEVAEDVRVGREMVIPRGTRLSGSVTHVKRAGRIKGRAEMNLRFDRLEFPGGVSVPLEATVVSIEERAREEVKDGEGTLQGPGGKAEDARKVGVSTGLGVLIGILTGGKRGAKVGAIGGALGGVAGVLITRGEDIYLYPDTEFVIKLDEKIRVPSPLLQRP